MGPREHVGELELHMEGASAAELFEQAARLLAQEESPDADLERTSGEEVAISLSGDDLAGLLVDWVNELIYLTETADRPFPWARVELREGGLDARVRGADAPVRHAVKAATLHGVEAMQRDARWHARVLVDV
jgi:SHS2 domain-containing protein